MNLKIELLLIMTDKAHIFSANKRDKAVYYLKVTTFCICSYVCGFEQTTHNNNLHEKHVHSILAKQKNSERIERNSPQ